MSLLERIVASNDQRRINEDILESLGQPNEDGRELHRSFLSVLQTHQITAHLSPDGTGSEDINNATQLTAFTPMCSFPTENGIEVGLFILTQDIHDYPMIIQVLAGQYPTPSSDYFKELEEQKGKLRHGGNVETFPENSPISLCATYQRPFLTKILTVDPEGKITTEGILRENPPDETVFDDIRKALEEMNTQLGELDSSARQDRIRQVSWLIGRWQNPVVQASA